MAILKGFLVERAGNGQGKGWDPGVEQLARVGAHLVLAFHGADGRLNHRCAGITEGMAGLDVRRFAYDAFAVHFLYPAIGIRDHPVTRQKPSGLLALISYRDGVGKDVAVRIRFGFRFEIIDSGVNLNGVLVVHGLCFRYIRCLHRAGALV